MYGSANGAALMTRLHSSGWAAPAEKNSGWALHCLCSYGFVQRGQNFPQRGGGEFVQLPGCQAFCDHAIFGDATYHAFYGKRNSSDLRPQLAQFGHDGRNGIGPPREISAAAQSFTAPS